MKYFDAPGTASSAAEINPPAEDSATAIVCFFSNSFAATFSAAGISSFMVCPCCYCERSEA